MAEAHELEERDEGCGKLLARLGAAGGAMQLHLDYSVLDGHLRNQRQFQVPGQGSVLISTLQRACVLLVAHVHLLHQQRVCQQLVVPATSVPTRGSSDQLLSLLSTLGHSST